MLLTALLWAESEPIRLTVRWTERLYRTAFQPSVS